jgi:hypothetical protein
MTNGFVDICGTHGESGVSAPSMRHHRL